LAAASYLASLTGSDPYLTPERRALDTRMRTWALRKTFMQLGVLLFVALTESNPVPGMAPADLQLLRPDASPKLAAIIVRAMSEAPKSARHRCTNSPRSWPRPGRAAAECAVANSTPA